jgi:hypothetical protein
MRWIAGWRAEESGFISGKGKMSFPIQQYLDLL